MPSTGPFYGEVRDAESQPSSQWHLKGGPHEASPPQLHSQKLVHAFDVSFDVEHFASLRELMDAPGSQTLRG